jgi:L-lactate dehydrogenase complex protein LldG
MSQTPLIDRFTAKAEAVSAVVTRVDSVQAALQYTVDVCDTKEACQVLASGCDEPLSPQAEDLCQLKDWGKIIAAPDLPQERLQSLKELCQPMGIALIKQGLREHLGGIDIGICSALAGIAETGTLVVDSRSEDLRLASMISEVCLAMLPASTLVQDSTELSGVLSQRFLNSPDYTAFITGASRTADIERVLTLGVHGPLELHIVILMDE